MGWYVFQKPGSQSGPCAQQCQHTDCAAIRKQAESLCLHCSKVIGYERKIVFLDGGKIAHFVCELESASSTAGGRT